MSIKRVGLGLANQVFQVHGVDYQDKVILRKQLRTNQMLIFQSTSLGLWQLAKLGHSIVLMNAVYLKSFVVGNKNDFNVAQAIFDAGTRSSSRRTVRILCWMENGFGLRKI